MQSGRGSTHRPIAVDSSCHPLAMDPSPQNYLGRDRLPAPTPTTHHVRARVNSKVTMRWLILYEIISGLNKIIRRNQKRMRFNDQQLAP